MRQKNATCKRGNDNKTRNARGGTCSRVPEKKGRLRGQRQKGFATKNTIVLGQGQGQDGIDLCSKGANCGIDGRLVTRPAVRITIRGLPGPACKVY